MQRVTLTVDAASPRLDRYVAGEIPELSRSQVKRLIDTGQIAVNGVSAKPAQSLSPGDVVRVTLPDRREPHLAPEPMPLDIVYEDDHLLVLNKPPGVIVHPGAGRPQGSLLGAVLARRPDIVHADADPSRPGIVHRLDRDTSGLILVAATAEAQHGLRAQFKARVVSKTYLTLVFGRLEPMIGAIEAPIARDPQRRTRMTVTPDGRYARTEYRVLAHHPGASFLEVTLITGRTHQIRVHLSAIGHPVVGDRVYGRKGKPLAPRQFLHSHRLGFEHPITGEAVEFTSPLPADLQKALDRIITEALR